MNIRQNISKTVELLVPEDKMAVCHLADELLDNIESRIWEIKNKMRNVNGTNFSLLDSVRDDLDNLINDLSR
jgi:hypothetical protein